MASPKASFQPTPDNWFPDKFFEGYSNSPSSIPNSRWGSLASDHSDISDILFPMQPPSHHPDVPSDVTGWDSEYEGKETLPHPSFRPGLNDWPASLPLELGLHPFDRHDVTLPLRIIKHKTMLAECKLLAAAAELFQAQISCVVSNCPVTHVISRISTFLETVWLCLAGIYCIPVNFRRLWRGAGLTNRGQALRSR